MAKKVEHISIRQVCSAIGRRKDQKQTLHALGLRRRGQQVTHHLTASIAGMVAKIAHLVEVKPIK